MTLIERRRTRQLSLTALLALNLHAGHSQWIKVVEGGGRNPGRGVESMEKAKPKAPSKATLLTHRVSEWAKCSRTSRSQCTDSTSTPSYFRLCLTAYTPLCRRACAIICGLLRWKRDEESRGVAITHTHTHTHAEGTFRWWQMCSSLSFCLFRFYGFVRLQRRFL